MLDTLEPSSIIEAAEQAASVGDYASAERLLREAARLQEARLGPSHPDLANTLNNLGVVCEITEKQLEAEQCYRRAYAIATAALEPNHPFVTTSGKNLRAFCEAHGKPVDLPQPPRVPPPKSSTAERPPSADSFGDHRPAAESVVEQPVAPRIDTQRLAQPQPPRVTSTGVSHPPPMAVERAPVPARPVAARQPPLTAETSQPSLLGKVFRPFPIAVVAISGLVLAVLVVLAGGPGSTGNGDRSAASTAVPPAPATEKPPPVPATQKPPSAAAQKAPPTTARPDPAPSSNATSNSAVGSRSGEKPAAIGPAVGVAIAQVCRRLATGDDAGTQGGWRCDSPESPVEPGQLFFYTRVKSAADTSVLHRWYRGDELRRSVELQIRASPTEGYRTYSRYMVDASSRGDWRLELRTKQGTLLHEERFTVR